MNIIDFIKESNRIEGITGRAPKEREIEAHRVLLAAPVMTIAHLIEFVHVVAGVNLLSPARQGDGLWLPMHRLECLLVNERAGLYTPYDLHTAYETLHPFTDGNGRSGRALWAWHMQKIGLDPFKRGFLHEWYYQSLEASRT